MKTTNQDAALTPKSSLDPATRIMVKTRSGVTTTISLAIAVMETAGLLVIAVATMIGVIQEVMIMISASKVSLAEILTLFIYLELMTMVGLYYNSGKLPVRYPLYIASVALARHLIVGEVHDVWQMIGIAGAILILMMAVLVLRFGSIRFPYPKEAQVQSQPEKLFDFRG